MNRMMIRLIVAIGIVVGADAAMESFHVGTPESIEPQMPLTSFGKTFDNWVSEEVPLDSETFVNTAADAALSRKYHDASGHVVSFLMAQYSETQAGLYHNPFNCYRSSGCTNLSSAKVPIPSAMRPEIDVSVSVWEKKGEKIMVMYWYEIADQVAFDRVDGMKLKWAFMGKRKWAPMYKVLMETPIVGSRDDAQALMVYFAGKARDMIGKASPPM